MKGPLYFCLGRSRVLTCAFVCGCVFCVCVLCAVSTCCSAMLNPSCNATWHTSTPRWSNSKRSCWYTPHTSFSLKYVCLDSAVIRYVLVVVVVCCRCEGDVRDLGFVLISFNLLQREEARYEQWRAQEAAHAEHRTAPRDCQTAAGAVVAAALDKSAAEYTYVVSHRAVCVCACVSPTAI